MSSQQNYEDIIKAFSEIKRKYEFMNKLMTLGQIEKIRKASVSMIGCDGNKILDVGSGPGSYLAILEEMCGKRYYVALDINEDLLKTIINDNIDRVVASGDHLPFRDKSFDLVVSAFMFRYLDHKKGLEEFSRVARKAFQIIDFWKTDNKLVYYLTLIYARIVVPLEALLFSRGHIHDYLYIYKTIRSVCRESELFEMAKKYGKMKLKFWFFKIIFSLVIILEK